MFSRLLCLLLSFAFLLPPCLAQVPEVDKSLYSQYFWEEVKQNLKHEFADDSSLLIARNRRYRVVGGQYTDHPPPNDAQDNARRSQSFWHEVENRRKEIDFYKNQAPPGDRTFRLRVALEKNTRASYRAVDQLLNILTPLSAGLSPNVSIDRQLIQGEIQDNIDVASNDPRTQTALQYIQQANQELLQAKVQFKSGNYEQGESHLDSAKAELDKAGKESSKLRKIVEAAILAGRLIQSIPRRGQRTKVPLIPAVVNNQRTRFPPLAPPIRRKNTSANIVRNNTPVLQGNASLSEYPSLNDRLEQYAAQQRAIAKRQKSDPNLQASIIKGVRDKVTGIGLGLNESKEQIKEAGTRAFNAAVRKTDEFKRDAPGTLNATANAAIRFGAKFADATMGTLNAAAKNPYLFDTALKESIAVAAQNYANSSQLEQGKAIGNFILWGRIFAGFSGSGTVAKNAYQRASTALSNRATKLNYGIRKVANAAKNKARSAGNAASRQYQKAKADLRRIVDNTANQNKLVPAGASAGSGGGNFRPIVNQNKNQFNNFSVKNRGSSGRSGRTSGGSSSGGSGGKKPPNKNLSAEAIENRRIQDKLPVFNGGKTSGILVTEKGETPLISGRAGPASDLPLGTKGFNAYTRTHVEGHAVAFMRQNGLTSATVHINNPTVCKSCNKLLPRMLQYGSKLKVVLPDGTSRTYLGVMK